MYCMKRKCRKMRLRLFRISLQLNRKCWHVLFFFTVPLSLNLGDIPLDNQLWQNLHKSIEIKCLFGRYIIMFQISISAIVPRKRDFARKTSLWWEIKEVKERSGRERQWQTAEQRPRGKEVKNESEETRENSDRKKGNYQETTRK